MSFLYIALALLVLMILFAFLGCRCSVRMPWVKENFAGAVEEKTEQAETKEEEGEGEEKEDEDEEEEEQHESSPSEEKPITPKQLELFNDLKDSKLSDDEIKKLIDEGILTNDLMEKFLSMLDGNAESAAVAKPSVPAKPVVVKKPVAVAAEPVVKTTKKPSLPTVSVVQDNKTEESVEGFCGDMYASAAF